MDEKRQLIYSAISTHHFSTIMERLYYQYKDGRNCDLEIKVSDGRIFAHKCLVDIFFTQAWTELEDDRFVLDLASYNEDVITALLDMMYTGELCIQPHLTTKLEYTARRLGYSEAEKGCKIYLNSYSHSGGESADPSVSVTTVKEEPVDTGYQSSAGSVPSGEAPEDFETFARNYVQNMTTSVQRETPPDDSVLMPCISSVSASKNIYEIVKGTPGKKLKLPDAVVEKANEEMASHIPKTAVDTAPALHKDRDPFLVVSRDNSGTLVLKKEKKIEPSIGKDSQILTSVARSRGKKTGNTVIKMAAKSSPSKKNTSKTVSKMVSCSTGMSDESSDEYRKNTSDEESDYEAEGQVVIENVEKPMSSATRSGRTTKRPAFYTEEEESGKRKRGRPRKPPMDPEEYERTMSEKLERRNRMYLNRKKVVIDKREYESNQFKLIAPAGIVPDGCRSRYGRAELMKTKYVTETVCKGDGSVSIVTKEIPRRMTWHERKADNQKASEPMFVICHPTAPVVRH